MHFSSSRNSAIMFARRNARIKLSCKWCSRSQPNIFARWNKYFYTHRLRSHPLGWTAATSSPVSAVFVVASLFRDSISIGWNSFRAPRYRACPLSRLWHYLQPPLFSLSSHAFSFPSFPFSTISAANYFRQFQNQVTVMGVSNENEN